MWRSWFYNVIASIYRFYLTFFNINTTCIQSLNLISIQMHKRKWLTACANFPLKVGISAMAGLSFFGISIYGMV